MPASEPYSLVENPAGEQRWKKKRALWVPRTVLFDPSRAEVALLPEPDAKEFVTTHHYSGSWPAARVRVGLFQKRPFEASQLVGTAVFGVGMQPLSISKYLGVDAAFGVELSRFVLLDEVAFNGESWFLRRCFRLLREQLPEVKGVLAYADPMAYDDINGRVTKKGHSGQIYRAFSASYKGTSLPRTIRLSPSGHVLSDRSLAKVRSEERGADYAYQDLLELGAPPRRAGESSRDYVRRVLVEGPFRRMRHPGKHVFTWGLGRAA